jgi:uncharacterized membrane protein YfcA
VELIPGLILALGGLVAGFLNVVAGGGSLITMPLLVFVGLPPTSAVGTIRLAIFVQSLTATVHYHRAGAIVWKSILRYAIPVCLGATGGALLSTTIGDTTFRALLGWVTLAAGAVVAIDWNKLLNREPTTTSSSRKTLLWIALFLVGGYAGLIQAGVGYLFLATLVFGAQLGLVQANVTKAVLVLLLTPITIVIFGLNSQIHLGFALALTLGQALGAYLGATLNLRGGARWIRPILAAVVVATAIKLLA